MSQLILLIPVIGRVIISVCEESMLANAKVVFEVDVDAKQQPETGGGESNYRSNKREGHLVLQKAHQIVMSEAWWRMDGR